MSSRFTDADRAEALLHASVFGDRAACRKYGCTARTLRNWRELLRDGDPELSAVFRRYAAAAAEATGDAEGGAATRAGSFADFLQDQVRRASEILVAKAGEINAANPEGLRAVNDHVATLLEHVAALEYISNLFGTGEHGRPDEPERTPDAGGVTPTGVGP